MRNPERPRTSWQASGRFEVEQFGLIFLELMPDGFEVEMRHSGAQLFDGGFDFLLAGHVLFHDVQVLPYFKHACRFHEWARLKARVNSERGRPYFCNNFESKE